MNNIELVKYANKCLELGDNSLYVYGTYGKTLTKDLCDSKHNQYNRSTKNIVLFFMQKFNSHTDIYF